MNEADLEDIKNLYVEGSFSSRWIEIETNHKIGSILNDMELTEEDLDKIAEYLKKPVDFLVDCQLFAESNPNLNETNFDKTISWSRIQKGIRRIRPVQKAKEKLTVKKVKEIIIGRQLANEITGNSERAFEDGDILTLINVNKPEGE